MKRPPLRAPRGARKVYPPPLIPAVGGSIG